MKKEKCWKAVVTVEEWPWYGSTLGSGALLGTLGSGVQRGISPTGASWWVLMAPPQKQVGYDGQDLEEKEEEEEADRWQWHVQRLLARSPAVVGSCGT